LGTAAACGSTGGEVAMRRVSLSLSITLLCLTAGPLAAGPVFGRTCSNPQGNEADIIYNLPYHTAQFCNGTSWRTFAGPMYHQVSAGSGCTNPTGNEGDVKYNYGYHTLQFCNGTNWISAGAAAQTPSYPNGYFVLSGGTYNGALGNLSGADSTCLTDLTTNTSWKGYATAKSEGLLVSGNVHAFLCSIFECNVLTPSTTYYFANASNASYGGASFTTDANGFGPAKAKRPYRRSNIRRR
jgi:hypothetical protein